MPKKRERILLDTNIIIRILKNDEKYLRQMDLIDQNDLHINPIVSLEIYYGMLDKETVKTKALIKSFTSILPDILIFRKAEELMLANRREKVKLADCIIAATCLVYGCTLYTNNRKDFEYLGVKLYEPKYTTK